MFSLPSSGPYQFAPSHGTDVTDPLANALTAMKMWETYKGNSHLYLSIPEIVFNPLLHPHGFHGWFAKSHPAYKGSPHGAGEHKTGDVIVTKSGKLFVVEKKTDKGVKVKPVDAATGATKSGYTVLAHKTQVHTVATGKAVGSSHPIGELTPGTFITTNAGKKFKIKAHGKWTTVLPVDDKGTVKGKHTVLPSTTVATIHHPDESAPMTPETVAKIEQAVKTAPPPPDVHGNILNDSPVMKVPPAGVIVAAAKEMDNYGLSADEQQQVHEAAAADMATEAGTDWAASYALALTEKGFKPDKHLFEAIDGAVASVDNGDMNAYQQAAEQWMDDFTVSESAKEQIHFDAAKIVEMSAAGQAGKATAHTWAMAYHKALSSYGYSSIVGESLAKKISTVSTVPGGSEAATAATEFLDGAGHASTFIGSVIHAAGVNYQTKDYPAGWSAATKWAQSYADAYVDTAGADHIDMGNELFKAVQSELKDKFEFEDTNYKTKAALGILSQNGVTGSTAMAVVEQAQKLYNEDVTTAQLKANGNDDLAWGVAYVVAADNVLKHDFGPVTLEHLKNELYNDIGTGAAAPPPVAQPMDPVEVGKQLAGIAAHHITSKALPLTQAEILQQDSVYRKKHGITNPGQLKYSELMHSPAYWTARAEEAYVFKHGKNDVYKPGLTLKLKAQLKKINAGGPASHPGGPAQAQHVQEVLPTKFPKSIPKPYEEGVGQHTHVVIRRLPGGIGVQIVRISPDGNEQMLHTHSGYISETVARRVAREHAAAHEAISEQTVGFMPMSVHLKPGDMFVTETGVPGKVVSVEPDGKVHYLPWRRHYGAAGGWESTTTQYTLDPKAQPVMPIPPHQLDEWPDHGNVRLAFVKWITAQPGGVVDVGESKQVRGAKPNSYSKYLHTGWDPEQLSGLDSKEALAAMKAQGYLEIRPRQKDQIRMINKFGVRMTLGLQDGHVSSIEQIKTPTINVEGTSQDFHGQLQQILESGGDLTAVDPRTTGPPEARTSFVRGLLHDMAVGRKKGVASSGAANVKSDEQYRQELEASGAINGVEHFIPQAQQNAPALLLTVSAPAAMLQAGSEDPHLSPAGYQVANPGQLTPQQRAVLLSILKRRGMAALALERNKNDLVQAAKDVVSDLQAGKLDTPAPPGSPFPTMAAYVQDNLNHWQAAADSGWDTHTASIDAAAKQLQIAHAQTVIDQTRAKEGTVKEVNEDFDLPTWDQVQFKPQSFEDIWNLITQDPAKRDVPAFYSGGLFQDGVLQHRKDRTDGRVPLELDGMAIQRLQQAGAVEGPNSDQALSKLQGTYAVHSGRSFRLDDGSGKVIEYVHHNQPAGTQGGAPTNQRGVLRMTGYEPQEAAARLQALGLLGDLEPQVPFDLVMRGPRRHGTINALHPAYVRGEAQPPKAKRLLRHGVSHGSALLDIVRSGGLKSISERWRLGVHKWGASPAGDIRSGIDHCNFLNYGNGAVGSGAQVQILMRPSAYLRRDIALADHDYGAAQTRYGQYRGYLNKLQKAVGAPTTNLYVPADPKVRQLFLDPSHISHNTVGLPTVSASAEFNIGPELPIEDWEVVGVSDATLKQQLDTLLEQMLASGQIKARPKVVMASAIQQHQRKVG